MNRSSRGFGCWFFFLREVSGLESLLFCNLRWEVDVDLNFGDVQQSCNNSSGKNEDFSQ